MSLPTDPPLVVVITGLVPVIHGSLGVGPVDGKGVDGRTKSGHDDRAP
jgi:hypothetical protein